MLFSPESKKIWIGREEDLSLLIVNYLVHLKDFQLATEVMYQVASRHPDSLPVQNALGRLLLQVGNVVEAKAVFLQIRATYADKPSHQPMVAINE